jgi:hypothetical protein
MTPPRAAAIGATVLAVLVLMGSALLGLRGAPGEDADGSAAEVGDALEAPERRIRVEVLNAAGIPRLAQRGTDRLRDRGFDVVHFGNARGFHADTTLVLDRVGDPDAAQAVARALGVRRVRSAPDSSLYLEVTVVLGRDWQP